MLGCGYTGCDAPTGVRGSVSAKAKSGDEARPATAADTDTDSELEFAAMALTARSAGQRNPHSSESDGDDQHDRDGTIAATVRGDLSSSSSSSAGHPHTRLRASGRRSSSSYSGSSINETPKRRPELTVPPDGDNDDDDCAHRLMHLEQFRLCEQRLRQERQRQQQQYVNIPNERAQYPLVPLPAISTAAIATSTNSSVQITSIDGFFNRKRGRPPKNRFVEVYKNTQQSPQAIFTSFKLERHGLGRSKEPMPVHAEHIPPEHIDTKEADTKRAEEPRLLLAPENAAVGVPHRIQHLYADWQNTQPHVMAKESSSPRRQRQDEPKPKAHFKGNLPTPHALLTATKAPPINSSQNCCDVSRSLGAVPLTKASTTATKTIQRIPADYPLQDTSPTPPTILDKKLSVVRAAGTFYPEKSGGAINASPSASPAPQDLTTHTVPVVSTHRKPKRRRLAHTVEQEKRLDQWQPASQSSAARWSHSDDPRVDLNEGVVDLSTNSAKFQKEIELQQHQRRQQQQQQQQQQQEQRDKLAITAKEQSKHDLLVESLAPSTLTMLHLKQLLSFYHFQQQQQHTQQSEQHLEQHPEQHQRDLQDPQQDVTVNALRILPYQLLLRTNSVTDTTTTTTTTNTGRNGAALEAPVLPAPASAPANSQKSDRIPVGYLKFRFNVNCGFPGCGYCERQSHFHCSRRDCHYSFCDKTRFVQHTARHDRLDMLMGDDFQQYRVNMRCGHSDCPYALAETSSANSSSSTTSTSTSRANGITKKSSHFHCLKCDFVCADTNKVIAHRRLHHKLEYIRMAGFRKVASSERCTAPPTAVGSTSTPTPTAGSVVPKSADLCPYMLKHTHYHCLVCNGSVLSRAQLAAHKHRIDHAPADADDPPAHSAIQ